MIIKDEIQTKLKLENIEIVLDKIGRSCLISIQINDDVDENIFIFGNAEFRIETSLWFGSGCWENLLDKTQSNTHLPDIIIK